METLTIELTHQKAFDLLNDLEAMNIIKVLHRTTTTSSKLSERFAGRLSLKTAEKLQNHINESRNSWDKGNI